MAVVPSVAPPTSLYRQLKPRPKGPARAQVEANQRRRLCAAMVEAVAERGYEAATVSYVCTLAGVSKRTLYQLFAGKQDCFLVTYDEVVRAGVQRISAAYRAGPSIVPGSAVAGSTAGSEQDWAAGLCRAFDAFVAEIEARPHAARLALVEVLAVGPAALGRIERGEALFARMISQSLVQTGDGVALSPVLLRGIVHGIWYVARSRLLEGRPAAMSACGRELLEWMLAYRSPAARLLDGGAADVSFAPLQGEASRVGGGDERTRMLRAAAQIVAAGGYEALTGGQVAELAGVELDVFSREFGSTELCFLACLELVSAQALARALRESEGAPDYATGVCRALGRLLDDIARDLAFARVAFVEVFAAGPAGVRRRAALMRSFAELLARRAPRSLRPSPLAAEAIVGAVWGVVHHRVVHGRARSLPGLSGHAAYLTLAPIVGAQQAVAAILAERARSRGPKAA
jgi:AcrR family transcriptional regulator